MTKALRALGLFLPAPLRVSLSLLPSCSAWSSTSSSSLAASEGTEGVEEVPLSPAEYRHGIPTYVVPGNGGREAFR